MRPQREGPATTRASARFFPQGLWQGKAVVPEVDVYDAITNRRIVKKDIRA